MLILRLMQAPEADTWTVATGVCPEFQTLGTKSCTQFCSKVETIFILFYSAIDDIGHSVSSITQRLERKEKKNEFNERATLLDILNYKLII